MDEFGVRLNKVDLIYTHMCIYTCSIVFTLYTRKISTSQRNSIMQHPDFRFFSGNLSQEGRPWGCNAERIFNQSGVGRMVQKISGCTSWGKASLFSVYSMIYIFKKKVAFMPILSVNFLGSDFWNHHQWWFTNLSSPSHLGNCESQLWEVLFELIFFFDFFSGKRWEKNGRSSPCRGTRTPPLFFWGVSVHKWTAATSNHPWFLEKM